MEIQQPTRIAILGAGNVGGALARSLIRAGRQVVIADRDPEEAGELAARLGAESAPDAKAAAEAAGVIVLAVPFAASAAEVCEAIAPVAAGKVVIDAMNPLNQDYSGLVTSGGPSGAERVQQWLPQATVVKAFNTVFAANQAIPWVDGEPVDGFVAADDARAAEIVLNLAGEMGFRPLYVGPLRRAAELEAMAFLNISLQAAFHGAWTSAWKLVAPPPETLRELPSAAREAVDRLLERERTPTPRD